MRAVHQEQGAHRRLEGSPTRIGSVLAEILLRAVHLDLGAQRGEYCLRAIHLDLGPRGGILLEASPSRTRSPEGGILIEGYPPRPRSPEGEYYLKPVHLELGAQSRDIARGQSI